MIVCEDCQTEDILYEDRDRFEAYCEECFQHLNKEYIEANGIKKI